ncbi:MAG TPA: transposase [Burkholderiaceae bacterium]
MAGADLAEGTRLAAATSAWVCFEDETGQALRPPRARTWARRGRTPVALVHAMGSSRVSAAGLACLKPGQPGRFFFRVRVHGRSKEQRRSLAEADYAELVTAAHRTLGAPVILVWDNLNTHRSKVMREFTSAHPDWLTVFYLPAYAPELNPVEGAWSSMKSGLGNLAPCTLAQLAALVRTRLRRIQHQPDLIAGFMKHTGLTLKPKPP